MNEAGKLTLAWICNIETIVAQLTLAQVIAHHLHNQSSHFTKEMVSFDRKNVSSLPTLINERLTSIGSMFSRTLQDFVLPKHAFGWISRSKIVVLQAEVCSWSKRKRPIPVKLHLKECTVEMPIFQPSRASTASQNNLNRQNFWPGIRSTMSPLEDIEVVPRIPHQHQFSWALSCSANIEIEFCRKKYTVTACLDLAQPRQIGLEDAPSQTGPVNGLA